MRLAQFSIYLLYFLHVDSRYPIVIIPDFVSSFIEAEINLIERPPLLCWRSSKWYRIWQSPFINLFGGRCFVNNFKLVYNNQTNRMVNKEGVNTRLTEEFGECKTKTNIVNRFIMYRTCQDMVNLLHEFGYGDEEIYTANYDFRYIGDSREFTILFNRLNTLIEEITRKHLKVILLSFGTGGPIVSHYLKFNSQYWKKTHLDSWYSINGPFGGALAMHVSNLVFSDYFWHFYLSKRRLHEFLSSLPISYFLLPSAAVFKDEGLLTLPDKYYIAKNLSKLLTNQNPHYDKILPFIKDIFVKSNPGIPTTCAHTSGVNTISSIKITNNKTLDNFYVNYSSGDGFATKSSLEACTMWDKSTNFKVTHVEFENPLNKDVHNLPALKKNLKDFLEKRQLLSMKV